MWYRIDEASAGKEITIDIPADTAWYIFNKDDICTAGSLFLNQTTALLLPEDGKIVFIGKEGSRVKINC